jgi:hypothetical protein
MFLERFHGKKDIGDLATIILVFLIGIVITLMALSMYVLLQV